MNPGLRSLALPGSRALRQPCRDRSLPAPSARPRPRPRPRPASSVCIAHSSADMHWAQHWACGRRTWLSGLDTVVPCFHVSARFLPRASPVTPATHQWCLIPPAPSPSGQRPDPLSQTELTVCSGCPSRVPNLIFSLQIAFCSVSFFPHLWVPE